MKHAFRKIGAVLLAAILTLAMAVPAFAADGTGSNDDPIKNLQDTVKVNNLPAIADSVSLYKVIDYKWDKDTNEVTYEPEAWVMTAISQATDADADIKTKYDGKKGDVLTDLGVGTEASKVGQETDATALLQFLSDHVVAGNAIPMGTISGGTASAQVSVGAYIAKVTNKTSDKAKDKDGNALDDATYNPMLVSVGVKAGDDGKWTTDPKSITCKSSTMPFDKYVTSKDGGEADKPAKGHSYGGDLGYYATDDKGNGVGTTVSYRIDGKIPSWSTAKYDKPVYKIDDTLDKGLTLDEKSIKVYLVDTKEYTLTGSETPFLSTADGGTEQIDATDAGKGSVATTTDSATKKVNGFTVDLSKLALDTEGNDKDGKYVIITYDAKLNADAVTGFDANNNTATLSYGNNTGNEQDIHKKEQQTHHYTFKIDGNILSETTTEGHEVTKTGEETGKIFGTTKAPLKGATFVLYKGTTKVDEVTTDDNGQMKFTADLDGNVEYELYETKAPDGYSVNQTHYTVKFVPTYDAEGYMTSYQAVITNKSNSHTDTTTYTAEYKTEGSQKSVTAVSGVFNTKTITLKDADKTADEAETTEVTNTKTPSLPSTGGMGTYIFTIGGVALIAFAAVMLVARRKRS